MGLMERQPYLEQIRNDFALTQQQRREIIDRIMNPMFAALESAVGNAVLWCLRANQDTKKDQSAAEKARDV
jgi:hypothetical protein